jgi:hypothetical protein
MNYELLLSVSGMWNMNLMTMCIAFSDAYCYNYCSEYDSTLTLLRMIGLSEEKRKFVKVDRSTTWLVLRFYGIAFVTAIVIAIGTVGSGLEMQPSINL